MVRIVRKALIGWGIVTGLVILEFLWIYSRHGLPGFEAFMQEAIYTHIPITLASVAIAWLLAGLALWLLCSGRMREETSLTWAGFFATAFLYLNILRERVRYGDIDYYTQAAFALVQAKPLPDMYFYPPLWATLLSFLTPLGEDGILLIAWIANVLSMMLFYFLLHRTLELYGFTSRAAALTTTVFLLVNMPVLRTFMYVQVNFHVMNCILLSLLLYRDRPLLSALALALGIHLKASPAVLVLAFLLRRDWKWLLGFAASLALVALLTIATYGLRPFLDFVNNFLALNAPHGLSLHDSSFDSAIGMALSYVRADFAVVRVLVLLAKAIVAGVVIFLAVRTKGFFSGGTAEGRLFDSVVPLFVGMTLLSPLVWEHHALFLTLPVLLLLKKLQSPAEWLLYGTAYLLVFLTPVFDYFPWSYGRLVGILILLGLLWALRGRTANGFFPAFNAWAESAFGWKAPARA